MDVEIKTTDEDEKEKLASFCKQIGKNGHVFENGDKVCEDDSIVAGAILSLSSSIPTVMQSLSELSEVLSGYIVENTDPSQSSFFDSLQTVATEKISEEFQPLQKACKDVHKSLSGFSIERMTVTKEEKVAKKAISTVFKRTVAKESKEERYILGIVLEPTDGTDGYPISPDTDEDVYSAEEVRKAAHWFMEHGQKQHGICHGLEERGGVLFDPGAENIVLLETYITPIEYPEDSLGSTHPMIKKGTWLVGLRINDDKIWQDIKDGKFAGLSIGGFSEEHPLEEGQ